MSKHNFLIVCLIVFSGFPTNAQTQYSYYFDNDVNMVKKSQAVFYGVGEYENGFFELKVFDKTTKKLLLLEHFTDSSLQVCNGLLASYFQNGNKEWEGNYFNGKQDGTWRQWNMQGHVLDSSVFKDGAKISENIFAYYPNGKLMSENFYSSTDNKQKIAFFDEEGNEVVPNSKEDTDKIFTKTDVDASFPGGLPTWKNYIMNSIGSRIRELNKDDYGTCVIKFIVDTLGNVSDIVAQKGCGKHISKIGITAIKDGPKWIPAQQNGRKVKAYRLQPITFQKPDE